MADTIGNAFFISLKGSYPIPSGRTPIEITRNGVDGIAFRQGSRRGETYKFTGIVDTLSNIAASNTATVYQKIKGTFVSVSLHGITFNNVLVLDCKATKVFQAAKSVGGTQGGRWIVISEWTLVFAGI